MAGLMQQYAMNKGVLAVLASVVVRLLAPGLAGVATWQRAAQSRNIGARWPTPAGELRCSFACAEPIFAAFCSLHALRYY